MVQGITGDIGQSIRYDYGDFVYLKLYRIRKEQILSYGVIPPTEEGNNKVFLGVHYSGGSQQFGIPCDSLEEAKYLCSYLDKQFAPKKLEIVENNA